MQFVSLGTAIKALVLFGLLAFVFVNVKSCQRPATGVEDYARGSLSKLVRLEAPPVQPQSEFVNASGETMRLSDYRGEHLLVNVWGTWCAPCVAEMPMLETVAEQRDDIRVVTIAFDPPERASDWLFERDLALPDWADTGYSVTAKLSTPQMSRIGLPITVFYGPTGRELARVMGEVDWESAEATAFLDHVVTQ